MIPPFKRTCGFREASLLLCHYFASLIPPSRGLKALKHLCLFYKKINYIIIYFWEHTVLLAPFGD